jgi:hypothetical protein
MSADRIGARRLAVDGDQCNTGSLAVRAGLLRRHDAEQPETRRGFRRGRHRTGFGDRWRAEEASQVAAAHHDIPDRNNVRRCGWGSNGEAEQPKHGSGRNQGPDHEC